MCRNEQKYITISKGSMGAVKFAIISRSFFRLERSKMSKDEKTNVEITSEGSVAVVLFKATSINNVDSIAAASKQIKKFIEENHPARMVFDFDGVKFFSSRVLGLILDIRAKLKAYDAEVAISAINPQLHRVFKITNLDKIFKFFPDKENAVKAVSPN